MSDLFIRCPNCRAVIGVWPDSHNRPERKSRLIPIARCTPERPHAMPRETSFGTRFGLIEQFLREYPDTHTHLSAARYIGPPSLLLFSFAFIFLVRRERGDRFKKILLADRWRVWLPFNRHFWSVNRYLLRQVYTFRGTPD
jgi:hypothetical protein